MRWQQELQRAAAADAVLQSATWLSSGARAAPSACASVEGATSLLADQLHRQVPGQVVRLCVRVRGCGKFVLSRM
jgi:hypothetical protein